MENKFFYEVFHKNLKPKSATSLHTSHNNNTINDVLVSRSNTMETQKTHSKALSEKKFLGYIMDRFKKQQCFVTLKRLMLNPDGQDFKDAMDSKRLARCYYNDISGMFIILKLVFVHYFKKIFKVY
jgi:hypothetical protein